VAVTAEENRAGKAKGKDADVVKKHLPAKVHHRTKAAKEVVKADRTAAAAGKEEAAKNNSHYSQNKKQAPHREACFLM
jgi:hypothetical protein